MGNNCQVHGAFSWCELLTTDTESAKHFYGKLFNWTLEPAPITGLDYTLVKSGGEKRGGIMAIPPAVEGEPPCWGVYVTVDDVEATAKLAVEMGGKVLMPPHDIPDVGRFSVLQDPQGAMISVITYLPKAN
ncbi:MAG: glyoxalase [Methylobacter sp.]|nr:MAG: glyoxalase [Methylobacter sp.]